MQPTMGQNKDILINISPNPTTLTALLQARANKIPFANDDGTAPSNAADFGGFYFDNKDNNAAYNALFTVSNHDGL